MRGMSASGVPQISVAKSFHSFQQWLSEGERLLADLLRQYEAGEAQLLELEARLADKQAEIQHLARILGRPAPELNRRLTAQLVTHYPQEAADRPVASAARPPVARPAQAMRPAAIAPRNPPVVRAPGAAPSGSPL